MLGDVSRTWGLISCNREELEASAEKVVFKEWLTNTLTTNTVSWNIVVCVLFEILDEENYQGNAVVNYTERRDSFTRIIEHKHFEYNLTRQSSPANTLESAAISDIEEAESCSCEKLEMGLKPSDILTREAFEDAITVTMALGGSTNATLGDRSRS